MEPALRVLPKEPKEYKTGPIYEYVGEPTILGNVTYRSEKGYNMTLKYGHIKVKMCDDGSEKYGAYYELRQVKAVNTGMNEAKIETSTRDGIILPADETVEKAIDAIEMFVEISVQGRCSLDLD